MLWLCIHLPHLPLEVFTRGAPLAGPLVVVSGRGGRRFVLTASPEAEAGGVGPGMALGAAHALIPGLAVQQRNEEAEARALESLGSWAGQFTSWVGLAPSGLLLEVEGSLGLFGGLESLSARVEQELAALGYRPSLAVAPTPLAAELLARSGRGDLVTEPGQLESCLAALDLGVLDLPERSREALRGLGLRTLGDCLRLPRSGLSRRLGPELPAMLGRALGREPDLRPPFVPPPRFSVRLELPAEMSGTEGLLFGANRLLLELEGFLRTRGSGVQQLRLSLFHREVDPTLIEVGLSAPGRNAKRLLGVLRERLERTSLSAPVTALGLLAADLVPLSPRSRDLFAGEQGGQESAALLLERLRARLGDGAVQGLRLVADHRPERAFQWVSAGGDYPAVSGRSGRQRRGADRGEASSNPALPRPLWLLSQPHCLPADLVLLSGPERIESGWWDGGDVARDYFVAEGAGGSRFWVFRECTGERRWFVHGIFG